MSKFLKTKYIPLYILIGIGIYYFMIRGTKYDYIGKYINEKNGIIEEIPSQTEEQNEQKKQKYVFKPAPALAR